MNRENHNTRTIGVLQESGYIIGVIVFGRLWSLVDDCSAQKTT